jgi:hypothetical protein
LWISSSLRRPVWRRKQPFRHWRTSWPWLAGLCIFAVVPFWFFIAEPSLQAQRTALADRLDSLQRRLLEQGPASTGPGALAAHFESRQRLHTLVADLESLAAANGLKITSMVYAEVDGPSTPHPGKVQVAGQLKGGYLPLKKMLSDVLSWHSSLALESCSLRRARSVDPVMDIELRFSFFYDEKQVD